MSVMWVVPPKLITRPNTIVPNTFCALEYYHVDGVGLDGVGWMTLVCATQTNNSS
jgi:hypothetical protein